MRRICAKSLASVNETNVAHEATSPIATRCVLRNRSTFRITRNWTTGFSVYASPIWNPSNRRTSRRYSGKITQTMFAPVWRISIVR